MNQHDSLTSWYNLTLDGLPFKSTYQSINQAINIYLDKEARIKKDEICGGIN